MFFKLTLRACLALSLLAPTEALAKGREILLMPFEITGRVQRPVAVITLGKSAVKLATSDERRAVIEPIEQATQKAPF